jgi:hypothetical protein
MKLSDFIEYLIKGIAIIAMGLFVFAALVLGTCFLMS